MKALLVVAHGSPRPEANEDVVRLAAAIREMKRFDHVEVAYLDCNQPDIPAGIDLCAGAGATEIVAVPYFLHGGRHFLFDVPDLLEEGEARHSGVTITMGDYIGHRPEIAGVIADRVAAVK